MSNPFAAELMDPSVAWRLHDEFFFVGAEGRYKAPPARAVQLLPRDAFRAWCHHRARYNVPTRELVDWLTAETKGAKVLEVGAGAGDLHEVPGLIQTDSKIQADPKYGLAWKAMGQPPVRYPPWVAKLDAIEAARKHKPDVIVAAWVTQSLRPTDPVGTPGCMFGPDLVHLKNLCKQLIFIGNRSIHGHMRLLSEPHVELNHGWLASRASDTEGNRIWIFDR